MADPRFYPQAGPFTAANLCSATGAVLASAEQADQTFSGVASISDATSGDLTFLSDKKHRASLGSSQAGACLLTEAMAEAAPDGMVRLFVEDPQRAFADAIVLFHPEACPEGISSAAHIDPKARLEDDVEVGAGAVIGACVEIGAGTRIGPGVIIGSGVCLGRNCKIGANVSIEYALLGDHVIIAANSTVGTDGFGFAMGPQGHKKIPQVGRVIIQDDVEIGAGTTIDRGALGDTVIGEGTRIDNLVQIGHNCTIGRHCILVGQVGLSGSTVLEDFVVMGGQAASAGHLTIGAGAMLAARSGVKGDLAAGGVYGGAPAKPAKDWMREVAAVARLARKSQKQK